MDERLSHTDEVPKLRKELKQAKDTEERLRKERNEARDDGKRWKRRAQELEASHWGPPKVVKDLKKVRVTTALIFYPGLRESDAYRLESSDVDTLQLDQRTKMGDLDRI